MAKIIKDCGYCSVEFSTTEARIKNRRGSFCSRTCANSGAFKMRLDQVGDNLGEPLKEWLTIRYIDELWSYKEITATTGMTSRFIRKVLDHYDIEVRDRSEAVATQWIKDPSRRVAASVPRKRIIRHAYGENGIIPEPEKVCHKWLDSLCVSYIPQYGFEKPNKKYGAHYQADIFLDELNTIIEVQSVMSNINPDRHNIIINKLGMRVFYIPSRLFIENVTRKKFLKFYEFITYLERSSLDPSTPIDLYFMVWRDPYCLMRKLNPY